MYARHFFDNVFGARPEADDFKWKVAPAGRDAKVRLVWRYVMDAMMLTREDDTQILEEDNVPRQSEVRVRPLVNLFT